MYVIHQRVTEAFMRVCIFLDEHPIESPVDIRQARRMLEASLTRLREHAGTQYFGTATGRAERERQVDRIGRLRDEFIRPVVTIARAHIGPGADVGIPAGFRMPKSSLSVAQVLQTADAMLEQLAPHEALFVAQGMPVDFLAQFRAARDAVALGAERRETLHVSRLTASKGIPDELRLGRLAVNRIDAIVRARYRRDEATLSAWRQAKRVHRLPGRRRVREAAVVAADPVVLAPVALAPAALAPVARAQVQEGPMRPLLAA
ncbi:MAG: hypothetical protein KA154_17525 [Gemmatimonadaceae bacterium]|nr:hypothetical protein [Gemmatimonadaceae bacterium]